MNKLNIPSVIGIAGVARSGKDTFFTLANRILADKYDTKTMRTAFADAVKGDCHQLLVKNAGISAYTDAPELKELIRPVLVAYGTDLMRKIDPNHWINKVKLSIDLSRHIDASIFITDVRYENEIDWIQQEEGGVVVHIQKTGCRPANKEERESDPILKRKADINVKWDHVGEGEEDKLNRKVQYALNKIDKIYANKKTCPAS